jgi:hypothetical protein
MARTGYHYIPRPDGDFDAWALQFRDSIEPFWSHYDLPKETFDTLKTAFEEWQAAYPAYIQAQAAAEAATQTKRAAREALEAAIRPVANVAQTFPATTDADRASFGLALRDGPRTPAATPATAPTVSVAPAGRLTHELRLVDSATPTRRGKPRGIMGAEVWVKLVAQQGSRSAGGPDAATPAPETLGDPATFKFLALTTKPTVRSSFKPDDGGKTAVYMLRWVNTRGEVGPWSEVATGTVAA